MLKKAASLILISLFAGMLSGCWDNRDINHRALPVTMGVSMKGDNYNVLLLIPEPVENTTRIRLVKGEGKTVTEAIDTISRDMESFVDMLHMKVVVFDKALAERGLMDSISGFMRARDISPKVIVVITDDEINQFFKRSQKTMAPEGTTLYDCFEKDAGWNPEIALTRVWEVYRSIHSYTRDVAIPIIQAGTKTMIEHNGSAIIKNGRMVGRISSEETLLMNAFSGESSYGKVEVMNHASVLIVSNTFRNSSKVVDRTPYMNSKIILKVSLLETRENTNADLIREELEKVLTLRCDAVIEKMKANEADVLGLGQFFRNKLPRNELQHWRTEYLPRLKMNFEVRTIIQNEGNLKMPS
ncbi:Ger(x)C family spore germination protein [Cohnella lupini]|uniref:Ger(X)C family germination protein n=1 Tax=Cohnella lupini TaxID=1294267 RepID=A0A3D9I6E4_9BACL|nr:Ger(x)C family spore germination protein [Cohnella lupini]RED57240.1 Ger(x)C family germination protein [Cohnella lupini]